MQVRKKIFAGGAGQHRSRVSRKCIVGTSADGRGSMAVGVACSFPQDGAREAGGL
jgi:hypothetical protein